MLWPKPNSKNSGFFQLLLCSLYVFKEKTIIEFCASVQGILANKCEFDHLAKVIRRINCSHSLLNHESNWHYFSATCVLKAYGAGKMLWVNVVAPTRRRAKYPCAEFINANKHVHEMYVLLTCISHQYYKLIKSVVIRTQLDENLRTGANYANFPGKSTSLKVNYWCKPLREINFKMACT